MCARKNGKGCVILKDLFIIIIVKTENYNNYHSARAIDSSLSLPGFNDATRR